MTAQLHVGLSTCPNDTFLFHGLLTDQVDRRGLDLTFELLDIEELNAGLAGGRFAVAKGSFALALQHADALGVLPTGSALGFGNGPLLLATKPDTTPTNDSRVLCPGAHTTAHLLYRLFHGAGRVEQVVFSEVMPALEQGAADFGVCIHEGRFTYAERGLACVEDLGARWELETASPLPLGGLFARRKLDADTLRTLQAVIADSLAVGHADPGATLPTMSKYAQEFSDEVLFQHVGLYVNEHTRDLGKVGAAALAELAFRARAVGWMGPDAAALEVLCR
jgi:1,4-dihydroxy-6-naphthoate synthase